MANSVFLSNVNFAVPGQTIGDLFYADSATSITRLADVATGQVLVSGGVGAAPAWSATPTLTSVTTGSVGTAGATSLSLVTNAIARLTISTASIVPTLPIIAPDGTAAAPSYALGSGNLGMFQSASNRIGLATAGVQRLDFGNGRLALTSDTNIGWVSSTTDPTGTVDTVLLRDAANTVAQKNGTNSQTYRLYGYVSGSRLTRGSLHSATEAVTLSGATSATSAFIPAGATVVNVATTTTTTITGATGYQVGDGSDADRYGDITGTAVGTVSDATTGTADPRWWTAAARAITLTAKTSNFTAGVVQVTVYYETTTAA